MSSRSWPRNGFTLLELILAVSILAIVSTVTYMTFSTVTTAWKRGMALTEDIHHGDFVIEQLVTGLRSAYYTGTNCGFQMTNDGEGERATDRISWVKLGSSLVGQDCPYAGSPHRIEFSVEEDEDGNVGAAIRSWRLLGQSEDFDPEDVKPIVLSKRVVGFNCRTAEKTGEGEKARTGEKTGEGLTISTGEIEWEDDWANTNALPVLVEVTLYMEPLNEGDEPVAIMRTVRIPVVNP